MSKELLTAADLRLLRTSSNEPDLIIIEIYAPGDALIADMAVDIDGTKSVHVGPGVPDAIEADAFVAYLARASADLDAWAADLRRPGGVWDTQKPQDRADRSGD